MREIDICVDPEQILDQIDTDELINFIGLDNIFEELTQKQIVRGINDNFNIDPLTFLLELVKQFNNVAELDDVVKLLEKK